MATVAPGGTQPATTLIQDAPTAAAHPEYQAASRRSSRLVGRHRAGPKAAFRGDVEGLRAVAVGLVLLYHAGLRFTPGGFVGVDVFFVISGFLITTQLMSELSRSGRISLTAFYARRAKRLLPAAGVVLVATGGLVYLFLPRTRWADTAGDIISASLYVVNWRFADRSVDYLAEGDAPSAVQHFWSLAVEEQYYLVWPLMILLGALIARLVRLPMMVVIGGGLAALIAASFAWSVIVTPGSPEAFFVTTTRMWELGIGAAVALCAGLCARLPGLAGAALSWLGLGAIAAAALAVTVDVSWPGYAAALPTLGAAAVIAGGFGRHRGGASFVLDRGLMRWGGGLSYSLYLWHWPLLVAATAYWGEGVSTKRLLVVCAAAVIPAWLTHVAVENPFRYSRSVSGSPRLALSLGANFSLVGAAAGLVLLVAVPSPAPVSIPSALAPGARILGENPRDDPRGAPVDRVDWMTPEPTAARRDLTVAHADGCVQGINTAEVITCEYGDPGGETTVAVVGDSKITQWIPALVPLAESNGWRLTTYLESGCSFAFATIRVRDVDRHDCRRWVDHVVDDLRADPPDWIVTSQLQSVALDERHESTQDAMVTGLRDLWSVLTGFGSRVVVIADNLDPGMNVYGCVEEYRYELTTCSFERDTARSASPTQYRAAQGQENVSVVDLNDAICPTSRCAPVIGNVLVYRETSHVSATYVRTLTPRLASKLSEVGLPASVPDSV